MPTQVKVIIGKNKVYATYVKTICSEQPYLNEAEMELRIHTAQATAFSYAVTFGSVTLDIVHDNNITNSSDVFAYLDKCHAE
jgi:hypothetical protein